MNRAGLSPVEQGRAGLVIPFTNEEIGALTCVRKAISDRNSFPFILIIPVVQVDTLCKLIFVTKLTGIK